ncbi:MAG TPA: type II secretion system F family protein [Candidatus Omnitrophota bacterium]|mgnify:CR=1 FL=1|nr:type II secretion system F family protein [Candidatus Omnitrophota bacterium]HPT07906.1 type II secretion system F family protein [Candidatus Omnitrophota bacterium]
MATFQYKARDKYSRLVSGITNADTSDAAANKLSDMGYVPITISQVRQKQTAELLQRFQRVSPEELNTFTRQIYSLQKAGISLVSSLESISQQTKSSYFKGVIDTLSEEIRGGASFSQALKKYPRIFNEIYVSLIKTAETSGNLAAVLERLTILIEQEIDTRSRIKAATRYPILAFGALCVGFLILISFVIPRFALIYGQFNVALPLPTRILIVVSVALHTFWYLFLFVAAGIWVGWHRFVNSKFGARVWDRVLLSAPVFGPLVSMLIISRFCRITALLMKSGVPILETLELAASASGNVIIAGAVRDIKTSVSQGKGMSEPMKISGFFQPAVIQMVAAGEQTGRMDELLTSVADYYDRETGYMIKNLATYIEPILITVLGCMVLVMALAIFLPMWNLIKLFRG